MVFSGLLLILTIDIAMVNYKKMIFFFTADIARCLMTDARISKFPVIQVTTFKNALPVFLSTVPN